jgi:hypothetical protein
MGLTDIARRIMDRRSFVEMTAQNAYQSKCVSMIWLADIRLLATDVTANIARHFTGCHFTQEMIIQPVRC